MGHKYPKHTFRLLCMSVDAIKQRAFYVVPLHKYKCLMGTTAVYLFWPYTICLYVIWCTCSCNKPYLYFETYFMQLLIIEEIQEVSWELELYYNVVKAYLHSAQLTDSLSQHDNGMHASSLKYHVCSFVAFLEFCCKFCVLY